MPGKDSKHRWRLRRRLAHLEQRIATMSSHTGLDFDRGEAEALRWALDQLETCRAEHSGATVNAGGE